MSITYGDHLKHNNPLFAIMDIEDAKGGIRSIATFSNTNLYNLFNDIPDKIKQNYSTLLVTTTNKYYYLSGTDATSTTSWTLISNGVSGSGTTNSVTKWTGESTLGNSIITDDGDTITINGNLLITGTTSTVNSENLIVKDPIMLLAGIQSATPSFDSGLFINRGNGATQAFIWDESSSEFSFFSTTSSSTTLGNVSIGTYSNVRTGSLSVGTGVTSSSRFSVSSTGGTISFYVNESGTTNLIYDAPYSYNTTSNALVIKNPNGSAASLGVTTDSNLRISAPGMALLNGSDELWFGRFGQASIQSYSGPLVFYNGSGETMRIEQTTGNVLINSATAIAGSKLFIKSSGTSSTIGSNIMLDLYNGDNNELGTLSEIAFSSQGQAFASSPYNISHRYAVISGYANTWNNLVTGGGIKFSTRNGTPGSLVTALVVSQNGSVYNASRGTNTLYGLDALLVSTGTNNTAIGSLSLNSNTTGYNNTAIGYQSLYNNTTGNANIALGYQSLLFNTTGFFNTAIGNSSLSSNKTGNQNVAIGYQSSYFNTSGSENTAVGVSSLNGNTIGSYNTAVGGSSLANNTTSISSLGSITPGSGYVTGTYSTPLTYSSGSTATSYPTATIVVGIGGTIISVTLSPTLSGTGFKDTTTIMSVDNTNVGGTGSGFLVTVSTLSTGSYNTALGYQSLYTNTTGIQNVAIGHQSLLSNTIGYNNTAIGHQSLYYNTTGFYNTAIGQLSLYSNTSGSFNSAIGLYSLKSNTTGFYNTGVGSGSLQNNISGNYNTSVGNSSLLWGTQSNNNTAIGFQSLCYNQSNQNTAIGYNSLFSNTTGYLNTAVGGSSLQSNTTGILNTAIGVGSLSSNTTGGYNVSIGYNSSYSNKTGFNNNAIGQQSLNLNITGSYNNAFGWGTQFSATQSSNNTSFGDNSLYYNLSSNLVAFGSGTLLYNTIGNYNTALGYQSLKYNITNIYSLSIVDGGPGYTASSTFSNVQLSYISGSTAISYPAVTIYVGSGGTVSTITLVTNGSGFKDTSTIMGANLGTGTFSVKVDVLQSGYSNTAVGYQSLYSNTTGYQNTAIGNSSLYSNTTGVYNTALGYNSLYFNLTGNGNTALGYQSLLSNTTGANNTTIGQQSLIFNTTGYQNTAVGAFSSQNNTLGSFNTTLGYVSSGNNKIGNNNVTIGYGALYSATQSSFNTAIGNSTLWVSQGSFNTTLGYSALGSMVIGDYNIGIGVNSGAYMSGTTSVATQSNNSIFIGYDTRPQLDNQTNQIVIGHGATGSGSNSVTLGASTITKTQLRGLINLGSVPVYANLGAAQGAGLLPGDVWQTPSNVLMVA